MMFSALPLHLLSRVSDVHRLVARQSPPPPPPSFPPPPAPPNHFGLDSAPPPIMGQDNNGKNVHSEETILFLFLAFGILIVLILILLLLGFQTYLSWRVAGIFVEGSDDDVDEKDFWKWDRKRKERKKALRALEKGRLIRGSWGYGSSSSGRPRTDEEMGMTGARGSSMMLDKFSLRDKKEKKAFWNIKRWI